MRLEGRGRLAAVYRTLLLRHKNFKQEAVLNEVRIRGRVLPERRNVNIPKQRPILYRDVGGFEAEFDIEVRNGEVEVLCKNIQNDDDKFQLCIIRSLEIVTAIIDVFAFSKGWALSVMYDCTIIGDMLQPIALGESSVQKCCTAFSSQDGFDRIVEHVYQNFNLRFAFHDLVASLGNLNYSAIAAARAIDAIRQIMNPPGTPEKIGWETLRKKLVVEKSYLEFISRASRGPRHGDRGDTSGPIQMEVTYRAWTIMNRYLEFMNRGGTDQLPEHEFPLLIPT